MGKRYFKRLLARLEKRAKALDERVSAATDVEEVRSLTAQRDELNAEIEDVKAELADIEASEKRAAEEDAETRAVPPANAEVHNAGITASFATPAAATQSRTSEDVLESMEYRTAFMHYIQRGTPIPAELRARAEESYRSQPLQMRAGGAIDTGDMGAVIPITIMREVINTVRKRYGNLYDKVTKLSVPGGVEFPIGELQADFSWITEDTVSAEKDIGEVSRVSFKYNTAEIRIAQTFLSWVLSVPEFESKTSEVIALAYRKAMDKGVVKGTGNGQMLGILNDTRVTTLAGHTIALTAAEFNNWTAWRKKFFAKLPLGYRNGEFIFPLSTVDSYLETMADSNNNPIFRQATGLTVNDGDARDPNGTFFGRRISLVEPDILPDFDTANTNDVIGIFWQPEEYAINENFGFMMRRYFDDNRNKWIDKAITVVDGKVLNPYGIYLITKG